MLTMESVWAARQRHDPAPLALRNPKFRGPSTVSVSQSLGSLLAVPGHRSPDVSHTPTEQLGRLFAGQLSLVDPIQHE